MTEGAMETLERTYTTLDRSDWGSGPWDGEPDKVQFIDAATGLDCLAVRNRSGVWCGYVGVPASHPWFEKSYGECVLGCPRKENGYDCWEHSPESQINVHGGVTYADACQTGPEDASICHLPFNGGPDHVWWFGFDTAHGGDLMPALQRYQAASLHAGDVYRDLAYVRAECASMAAQLAAIK